MESEVSCVWAARAAWEQTRAVVRGLVTGLAPQVRGAERRRQGTHARQEGSTGSRRPAAPSRRYSATPLLLILGVLLMATTGAAAEGLTLARAGRALGPIVCPGQDAVEQFAAGELARYLSRMADAPFPVQSGAPQDRPFVAVGTATSLAPYLRTRALSERAGQLGEEGFLIRVEQDRALVIGGSPRAALYGVYDLLERDLGARWTVPGPDGERIPRHDPLVLRPGERREAPAFPLRAFDAMPHPTEPEGDVALIDWAAKRKLNLFRMGWCYAWAHFETRLLPEIRKRGLMSGAANHAFGTILPPDRHGATHPHYYALRDGARAVETDPMVTQLCTTNPETVAAVARSLESTTEKHPELAHLSLLQGDGWAFCQCPECARLVTGTCERIWPGEGVPDATPLLLRFVADVRRALASQRPGVTLWYDAYSPTIEPPGAAEADPDLNVLVWLYWRCALHSLGDQRCTRSRQYAEVLRGWRRAAGGRMMVTDYWCGITQPVPWWPTFTTMKEDYRFLRLLGIEGAAIWGLSHTWFRSAETSAYLNAELLWDLDQDVWQVMRRFCEGRYGAAAETMQHYYRAIAEGMERAAAEEPVERVANTWSLASRYVRDPKRLRALIDEARAKADDPDARRGVEDAWVQNEYACLLAEVDRAHQACQQAINSAEPSAPARLAALRQAVDAFSTFHRAHASSGMFYGSPDDLRGVVSACEEALQKRRS